MKHAIIALLLLLCVQPSYAGKSRTVEKRVATKPGERIEVSGIAGSKVRFRSWAKDEVYVQLKVSISSSDDDYESDFLASVEIDDLRTPDGVRLSFREGEPHGRKSSWVSRLFGQFFMNKEISGDVYVPQNNPLTTDMKYGSLTLEGMTGDVQLLGTTNSVILRNCAAVSRIENDYGTTRIANSGGNLTLSASSSELTVTDFAGSLEIDANYSTVSASHVSGDVSVADQGGTVSLDDVGGNAAIDAKYSTITLSRVKGVSRVESASGVVHLRDVGGAEVEANYSTIDINGVTGSAGKQLYVKSQSGQLTIEDVVGEVVIDNPYSTMNLSRIRGSVTLTSTSATIEADEVSGDWKSQTQYSTITLRQLSAKSVSITNSSNPVKITMKSVPSTVNIRNTYGDVRVSMPGGFSGSVELDAEYGAVETNLPIAVRTRSGSGFATGKLGAGTGVISIETESGAIDLQEK